MDEADPVEHKLFFASRRSFNDPFDCVVPNFLQRFVEEKVKRKCPYAAQTGKDEKISALMSVESLEDMRRNLQQHVDRVGIVCFSTVRDDILMWAHYADKHRGLCLEFDGSANCQFFGDARPVEYEDYTPIPLGKDIKSQLERIILTKSKHWSYEREYRIVQAGKACSSLDYPVELLTGVIFGCNMPDTVRKSVKKWTEEGHCCVAFFEARPKAAEFGLEIVRIDR